MPDDMDVLRTRYEFLEPLGRGSQGTTRLARDLEHHRRVVIKELELETIEDWHAIERFERERHALATLDHARIPDHIEGLQIEDREGPRFFLVSEYIEGRALSERLEAEQPMSETEVCQLLNHLLDVLDYLHTREPPILHRDVTPSNILERDDGSHVLIDFGTIESMSADVGGPSRAVGTIGYTAPEQMQGRAEPASDLYGLGRTALTMLSARSGQSTGPSPDLRDELEVHGRLADLLERMIAPSVDDRPDSAERALELLREMAI